MAHTAAEIIKQLGLEPHPEGGHFRQTFQDSGDGRAHSTAIYYLLAGDEISRWHRIDVAEVWHYYAGAPLELSTAKSDGPAQTVILGPDIAAGERPQVVVPARTWQAAVGLGDWTLLGCTVAPGFEFASFEMAPEGWAPGA
ncbi:MAG: cupin domain-containing protein [Alphaproteobacteria bacterium]